MDKFLGTFLIVLLLTQKNVAEDLQPIVREKEDKPFVATYPPMLSFIIGMKNSFGSGCKGDTCPKKKEY